MQGFLRHGRGMALLVGVLVASGGLARSASADPIDFRASTAVPNPGFEPGARRLTRTRPDALAGAWQHAPLPAIVPDSPADVILVEGTEEGAEPAATDLPPVLVTAPRVGDGVPRATVPTTSSFARVGPNRQPVWTTHRRFATTRAYVNAPWQVEFESWWEGKFKKDGSERHRYLEEVSIGLPGRVQLDLYWRVQHETGEPTRYSDFQIEARWALAPWNCLPLNPTLYGEYKILDDEPDVLEGKVLFAAELGRRWQWALNFFYERQLGGGEEVEMGFSQAFSYTVCDPSFSLGVEMKLEHVTEKGARDDPEIEFLLGPTIQWRPTRTTHIDIAPLFGLTDDSPDAQIYVVFGIDLFPGTSHAPSASLPTSSRAR